jgi:hypothetical protein
VTHAAAGLDKITNTFQHIFGNVRFDSKGVAIIFCAVVIFAAQFSLYFGTSEKPRESDNRTLAWFFSHFFYLSALIVTLQGEYEFQYFMSFITNSHQPYPHWLYLG